MKNLAQFLFGKTKKPDEFSKKSPDYSVLSKPFEWKESVAFCFCLNCGLTLEVNENLAKKYATELKIELPKNPKNTIYFELDGCDFCSEKESGIKLKNNEANQATEKLL